MSNIFTFEDLFITVRDKQLRAYNRLVLFANLTEKVPKVAQQYLRYVKEIDSSAAQEFATLKRSLRKEGLSTVQKRLKYRTNPYENTEVTRCTKRYRPFS